MILKIVEKPGNAAEPIQHLFHFNSATDPRGEARTVKDALAALITAHKAKDPNVPLANGTSGSSAAMAIASAVSSKSASERWYDDTQLKNNIELQQSLMKKDPALHRTYMEARRTKPDTISDSHFNSQFWSTRTGILRAHGVESNQKKGAYHVLGAVKPRQVDGELKMNISAEQVQLIFIQHPLVKRVYDENVPKLNETEFWSRFFLSRLFKQLRGERILEADSRDAVFDKYLNGNNELASTKSLLAAHVPKTMDLEANEENTGGVKSGNRQDFTSRPDPNNRDNKMPIVRVLNSLSEKIMVHVKPSDVDPSAPIGMDEETFNELALRDLRGDAYEERIMLNIKEQSQFFSSDKSSVSAEAALYAKQVPSKVLGGLRSDMDPSSMNSEETSRFDLRTAIGVQDDSDSDDDEATQKTRVGSRNSREQAQKQILQGIVARRSELEGTNAQSSLSGLSQKLFDRLTLTHATTTEFLHHFWALFLSGDPDRAGELARMVETLERAMDRINAVAADAEKEKDEIIRRQRQHICDVFEQTGKKLQWNANSVGGGEKVVKEMMEPTIRTLQKASKEYRKALAAEGVDTSR